MRVVLGAVLCEAGDRSGGLLVLGAVVESRRCGVSWINLVHGGNRRVRSCQSAITAPPCWSLACCLGDVARVRVFFLRHSRPGRQGCWHSDERVGAHDRWMDSSEQTTDRSAPVERLHEQLQTSLQELVTSEDWQQALAVAARFHEYSFANTRLIWSQAVARGFTPSRVAGYRAWQELGRHVREGERGLQILAPLIRKIELEGTGEAERRVAGFRVVHVFDLAQTEGRPLPEVSIALVEGELPAHWARVEELITDSGFAMEVADVDRLKNANGITDWTSREVVVRASLPGAQRFKTAIHELAHIRLHEPESEGRPNCRGIVEVEAESVAYMVCAALGIDSAGYSLPYVASWSGGDVDRVKATAGRVIDTARQVIGRLGLERDLETAVELPDPTRMARRDQVWEMAVEPAVLSDRTAELQEVLSTATSFFRDRLNDHSGTRAREYVIERGFAPDTVEQWQLGYAPSSWDALTNTLAGQGFSEEVMLGAGVVGRSTTGRLYDLMRGRLIFPVLDETGGPRGFAGRLIAGEGPKYLNGPETALYTKRTLLYGLNQAGPGIAEAGEAIVVEGYTDALIAHQLGFTNVVATGGTALTKEHMELLSRSASFVVLAFDGDAAGLKAVERAASLLDSADVDIRVATLPTDRDPADLLSSRSSRLFEAVIAEAVPLMWHLIDGVIQRHNLEEPEAAFRAVVSAAPIVGPLTPDRQSEAVTYLASRLGQDQAAVASAIDRYANRPERRRSQGLGRGLA